MLLIQTHTLTFSYPNAADPTVRDISCALYSGDRIGMVGPNGSGKTTLLKLLAGALPIEPGLIHRRAGLRVGYLPQEEIELGFASCREFLCGDDPELLRLFRALQTGSAETNGLLFAEYAERGGFDRETRIETLRDRFRFDDGFLERPPATLSGGEKTRLALLRLLLAEPDILFLDEPTNHLDTDGIVWLERFVAEVETAVVAVSHDRAFLDSFAEAIWELERGRLTVYGGDFSTYKRTAAEEADLRRRRYEETRQRIKKLEQAARERRVRAERNERFKPKRSVKKNGGLCKIDAGQQRLVRERNLMRSAKALEQRIGKEKAGLAETRPVFIVPPNITLSESSLKNRIVIRLEHIAKAYDGKPVLKDLSLAAARGEKIALMGRNGAGKSTLLRIMAGIVPPDEGTVTVAPRARIGYFAQGHDDLAPEKTVLEIVARGDRDTETRARTLLGSLQLRGDTAYQKAGALSAGQKSKVALVALLMGEADLLLLDEPLAHLEIMTREAFEEALIGYAGTVICVTHDRRFAENFATRVINL